MADPKIENGRVQVAVKSETKLKQAALHYTTDGDAINKRTWKTVAATIIVGWMIGYSGLLWDHPLLAEWLPFSSLIVIANWFPLFLLALAALVVQMEHLQLWRRGLMTSALAAAAAYALFQPVLGSPPVCGNAWNKQGDCVQTTQYTCSAASAATLLHAYGIQATESEMAELCLTRHGTSWMGLYRGLKLKTENSMWDVEVIDCAVNDLRSFAERPMILNVGLPAGASQNDPLHREHGWQPGMSHSVVLLGFRDASHVCIADPSPSIGREEWNLATMHRLWHGKAIRLVERWPISEKTLLAAR